VETVRAGLVRLLSYDKNLIYVLHFFSFKPSPLQRTYGICILCISILAMHTFCQPYLHTHDNIIESISLFMLCYAAITRIAYTEGKIWDGEKIVIVRAIHIFVICTFLFKLHFQDYKR
jgi:hypothetical protein